MFIINFKIVIAVVKMPNFLGVIKKHAVIYVNHVFFSKNPKRKRNDKDF